MQNQIVKKVLCRTRTHFAFFTSIHRPFSTYLPPLKSPFAVEYLVKSCGLPRDKAIKASKYIPQIRSPAKPDIVLQFLRQIGLGNADIRKAVSYEPRILCASLENTIKPRLMDFKEIGFSPSQVARLASLAPILFTVKDSSLQRKIKFWTPFLGSLERIISALKRAPYLLTVSVEKVVQPNISFLEEHCGVSPRQIGKTIVRAPFIFTMNPDKMKDAAQRAEELGSPKGSGLFVYALQIALCCRPSDVDAKIKNLKNLGFSKNEVHSMIKKHPMLLTNSDERIGSIIGFLTSEAGLDLPSIAVNPVLISLSLERRLIPRHYVLQALKSKGLCENSSLSYVMNLSEKRFGDRIVRSYKDITPEVFEAYEAARAGKTSLKGKL